MHLRISIMALAVLGGIASALVPSTALAGNVGTYGSCFGGSKNTAITAAGHTPVAVSTLDAASLAGLSGLIVETCNAAALPGVINADVKVAVSNGMFLVVNDWVPSPSTSIFLPGAPALTWQYFEGRSIDLVPGMPYISGPGGTLTDVSLDNGDFSSHGYTTSTMPAGVFPLLTTASSAQTVAIAYKYGSGRVVYSAMPMDAYLPGVPGASLPVAPGMQTYLTNILANNVVETPTTTCASEGYTGTKLTWCKNICENGLTGATLDTWIHRWINRYRDLPYCAVEGGGEEERVPTLK